MKKKISDISGIFSQLGKHSQLSSEQQSNQQNDQQSSLLNGLSKASDLFQLDQSALKDHAIIDQFDFSQMVDSFSGVDASVYDIESLDLDENLMAGRQGIPRSEEQLDGMPKYPANVIDNINLLNSNFDQSFLSLIQNLQVNLLNEEMRRLHASNLWQWARLNLPLADIVQYFASSTAMSHDQREALIGKFTVHIARLEMMIGWIHLGGVTQSPLPTWERSEPDNLDDQYTSNLSEGQVGQYLDWGSAFIGVVYKRTGLIASLISKGLFKSAKDFHDQSSSLSDCTLISTDKWKSLSSQFDMGDTVTTLSQFYQQNFTPQAGDIIVLGRKPHRWKSENDGEIALVEKYDTSSTQLHLIRGDFDRNRVGGEIRVMNNKEDWEDFISAVRFRFSAFIPSAEIESKLSFSEGQNLLLGLENHSNEILKLALENGWFHKSVPSASIAELYQEP